MRVRPGTTTTADTLLAQGYSRCAAITREHGTTYWWGARLLPRESRRHVHAVYALARLADDIVDLAGPEPGPGTAAALDAFERSFWDAVAGGTSSDPVLAAVWVPWSRFSACLLYTSPSPRDGLLSRMPSSA